MERSSKVITTTEFQEAIFFDSKIKANEHFMQSIQNTKVWAYSEIDKWLRIDDKKIYFIVLATEDDWYKMAGMAFHRINFDHESTFNGKLILYALSRWKRLK